MESRSWSSSDLQTSGSDPYLDQESVPLSKGYNSEDYTLTTYKAEPALRLKYCSHCKCQAGSRPCSLYHSDAPDYRDMMENRSESSWPTQQTLENERSCTPTRDNLPERNHGNTHHVTDCTTLMNENTDSELWAQGQRIGNQHDHSTPYHRQAAEIANDGEDCSEISRAPKPKPHETSIEMSTQTERDMSDYPAPFQVPPPPPPPAVRCESRGSLTSNTVGDCCRICHCESEPGAPLISPCVCCGSLKFVHQACLQQWIKSADTKSCELCKFDFEMTTRIKPFRKWQKLEMTTVERRKIMCSVTFHIIAITCVIWSLYVLIDRTTEEIRYGLLEWPFWTKLIVVAIGFTGGLVFMYVQCKMYVQLCRRWRAYNRVIFIQNCPNLTGQKIPLQPHMLDANGLQKDTTQTNTWTNGNVQETELL